MPQIIWAAGRAAWVGDCRLLHTAVKDISSTWLSGCGREHPEGGGPSMERIYTYIVRAQSNLKVAMNTFLLILFS